MASNARTQQLLESAAQGDVEKVRSLLRAGVGINEQHHMNGWTALHWACKRDHPIVVRALLEKGADILLKNNKDQLCTDIMGPRVIAGTNLQERAALALGQTIESVRTTENDESATQSQQGSTATFVPNYLRHPEFFYAASLSDDGTTETVPPSHGILNGNVGVANDSKTHTQHGQPRVQSLDASTEGQDTVPRQQGSAVSDVYRRAAGCFDVCVTIQARQVQRKFTCVSPDTTIQELMDQLKLFCDGDSAFMSLADGDGGTILPNQTCGVLRAYMALKSEDAHHMVDVLKLNISSFTVNRA